MKCYGMLFLKSLEHALQYHCGRDLAVGCLMDDKACRCLDHIVGDDHVAAHRDLFYIIFTRHEEWFRFTCFFDDQFLNLPCVFVF